MSMSKSKLESRCSDLLDCVSWIRLMNLTEEEVKTYAGYLEGKYDLEIEGKYSLEQSGSLIKNDILKKESVYSLKITKLLPEEN